MKKALCFFTLLVLFGATYLLTQRSRAADDSTAFQTVEYATIRWAGRENTHVIRPNGRVDVLGPLFTKIQRPDRVDERAFYMNVALNAVAKEGYELVGMTSEEIVMKRPLAR